jgi:hypothetical protein
VLARQVHARLTTDTLSELRSAADQLNFLSKDLGGPQSQSLELSALPNRLHAALTNHREPEHDDLHLALILNIIASSGRRISSEQQILYSLRFVRISDRYSSISNAHRNTLGWLFNTDGSQNHKSGATNFADWLKSDEDLYWVSGRPGSGKSTLIKYLCTHELTLQYLQQWARGDEVIIAEYFFWNAGGNHLQKSQKGLIRTLLYQILRKCPSYMCAVFPGVWQMLNPDDLANVKSADYTLDVGLPNDVQGLLEALKRTCDLLTETDKRLCFFIDGLDEYEGDTRDVISLVGILRALKHVKICVSSRQWNEFEEAYGKGGAAKIYMQDFNHEDINAYIDDVFANDDNYQEMEDIETHGKALVEEIVAAANGVFLWVVLVVRSFQEGLREGDSITRLQHRLRTLPTNLEEYFERILFHDVKDTYRDQAAQMFLVALVAKETLPLMSYWFLDEHDLPTERQPLKLQQTIKRHKDAKKRLIASCKGLLEPHYQRNVFGVDSLPSAILFEYRVDFLHRTVRDYLELPGTEIRHWAPAGFNPHEAICRVIFSQIKTAPQGVEYGPHIVALYEVYNYHAEVLCQSKNDFPLLRGYSLELADMVRKYDVEKDKRQRIEDHTPANVEHDEATAAPAVGYQIARQSTGRLSSWLRRQKSKMGARKSEVRGGVGTH